MTTLDMKVNPFGGEKKSPDNIEKVEIEVDRTVERVFEKYSNWLEDYVGIPLPNLSEIELDSLVNNSIEFNGSFNTVKLFVTEDHLNCKSRFIGSKDKITSSRSENPMPSSTVARKVYG